MKFLDILNDILTEGAAPKPKFDTALEALRKWLSDVLGSSVSDARKLFGTKMYRETTVSVSRSRVLAMAVEALPENQAILTVSLGWNVGSAFFEIGFSVVDTSEEAAGDRILTNYIDRADLKDPLAKIRRKILAGIRKAVEAYGK